MVSELFIIVLAISFAVAVIWLFRKFWHFWYRRYKWKFRLIRNVRCFWFERFFWYVRQ